MRVNDEHFLKTRLPFAYSLSVQNRAILVSYKERRIKKREN